MIIYLAGKISGERNYFEKFADAAERLRLDGHAVYNPAAANLEGMQERRIMAHVLGQLCESEAIALLPCWRRSAGARVEFLLARKLGLRIIWL